MDPERDAKILRCHFVEQWGVHTIAVQLGIHHTTVDRVLSQAGMPKAERARRTSIIDPYIPFILETLAHYPRLTAARLYTMAVERGFPGGPSHFRARQPQKVTHQGSPPRFGLALLCLTLNRQDIRREQARKHTETALHCQVCHRICDPFLRRDFLRPPERGKTDRRW